MLLPRLCLKHSLFWSRCEVQGVVKFPEKQFAYSCLHLAGKGLTLSSVTCIPKYSEAVRKVPQVPCSCSRNLKFTSSQYSSNKLIIRIDRNNNFSGKPVWASKPVLRVDPSAAAQKPQTQETYSNTSWSPECRGRLDFQDFQCQRRKS